jgi:dipeptide/tripeptide permease
MPDIFKTFRLFSKNFWIANVMELFERWAWYGFYNALALYLTLSKDTGALGFSQAEMGIIMGTGSMLLYFLPVITGALADKIGYKKVLLISFTMYVTGYFMLATFDSFGGVFFAFLYTAVGGAFFKPIISGTIAKETNEKNASVGFGIFYMMVNIGAFLGPFIAGLIYKVSWNYVFGMSMGAIALNYLFVLIFFKEPVSIKNNVPLSKSIVQAFKNIGTALSDIKYLLFLFIMIGFWTAYNQFFYSFPVFVEQWGDTTHIFRDIHSIFPAFAQSIGTSEGSISAVTLTSIDAFFIIAFQIIISSFVMRFKPLNAMIGGILVLSIGLGLMFATQNGWFLILGIFIFGLGEMSSSPKFTEYIGRIAPADKKALYMGTSFLPIAAAHQLSGFLVGNIYEPMADKFTLLKMETAKRSLNIPSISESFTQNEYFVQAGRLMGMNQKQLTDFLWNQYHPSKIWVLYSGIAVGTALLLFAYDKLILKSPKKN